VAPVTYTAALAIGAAGTAVWMANGVGIYLSSDGGATWRTITPPMLATGVGAGDRVGSMVGVGTQDLWLPVEDVPGLAEDIPGLIPPGSASVRGSGIEHSIDGGRTWLFTALPGCVQTCGADLSLSFPHAEQGFASIGPDQQGKSALFATDDGGATWSPVAHLPGVSGSRIVFKDAHDGWNVDAVAYGGGGGQFGTLARTTDGGVTWGAATGLPPSNLYQPPVFFGAQAGVVLARPRGGAPTHRPRVFVTNDGGTTWTARATPLDRATASWARDEQPIPFSAATPTDWLLFVGPRLYVTADAGRTWKAAVPRPTWKPGELVSMVFATGHDGWLVASKPGCPDRYPMSGQEGEECYSVLMATTDGGRHWAPRNP
jgi:photosystem II stability/assembly factor-like uncharacterized protein